MEENKKYSKEDAYQTLDFVNSWISNVDAKASFGLAFVAVLAGFIFYNIGETPTPIQEFLEELKNCTFSILVLIRAVLVVVLYISCLVSIIMFFAALFGRIKSPTGTSERLSLIFFGTIAQYSLNDYKCKALDMDENAIEDDLLEQIYINSKICKQKFEYYNQGIYALVVATILCFVCITFNLI